MLFTPPGCDGGGGGGGGGEESVERGRGSDQGEKVCLSYRTLDVEVLFDASVITSAGVVQGCGNGA